MSNKQKMPDGYKIVPFPINKKVPVEAVYGSFREPQAEVVPQIIRAIVKWNKSVLLIGAPGFGKTKISMAVASYLRTRLKRLIIIATPTLGINEGFMNESDAIYDKKYRIERNKFTEIRDGDDGKIKYLADFITSYNGDEECILICSYASLVRAYGMVNDPSVLKKLFCILDEGHHSGIEDGGNNQIGDFLCDLDKQGGARYLITTATPYRSNCNPIIPNEENCVTYEFDYYKLLWGYKTPYVANQSISMICYDFVKPEDIVQIENNETDGNRYCSNIDKYIDAIVKRYNSNPVQTLIIAPNKFVRGNTTLAEVCLRIEEVFSTQCPNARICNLGGTYDNEEAVLTSSTKGAKNLYKELKSNPEKYDIVISIKVMDEGIDWTCCRQTFVCGVTQNLRLFIQRDIGRGARMKPTNNYHELCYFIIGVDNKKDSGLLNKSLEIMRKHFVHFQSLLVLNGVYASFIRKYNVPLPKSAKNSKKEDDIPQAVRIEFVDALETAKMEKEVWTIRDTVEFIKDSPLLDDYTESAKIDLIASQYPQDANKIIQAIKDTNRQYAATGESTGNFKKWYEIFIAKIGTVEICSLSADGLQKYDVIVTQKISMKKIKSLWARYNRELTTDLSAKEAIELKRIVNEKI